MSLVTPPNSNGWNIPLIHNNAGLKNNIYNRKYVIKNDRKLMKLHKIVKHFVTTPYLSKYNQYMNILLFCFLPNSEFYF
jgi:hypothetical protein